MANFTTETSRQTGHREGLRTAERARRDSGKRPGKRQSLRTELLRHVSELAKLVQMGGLGKEAMADYEPHLKIVAREYGISPVQAALLSQFLFRFHDPGINEDEIADAVNCTRLELLLYQDDFEALEEKELITYSLHDGTPAWLVPAGVVKALKNGTRFEASRYKDLSLDEFFEFAEDFLDHREHGNLEWSLLVKRLRGLLRDNAHLLFAQKITGYGLGDDSLCLLMYWCYYYYNHNRKKMGIDSIYSLYEKRFRFREAKKALYEGCHELLKKQLLTRHDQDPWEDEPYCFSLSDRAKKELFGEHLPKKTKARREQREPSLIRHKSIKPRELYYNKAEAEAVQRLSRLLAGENLRTVQKRLKETNLRTGFACLFSGGPGTGKTETALQLARRTGRDMMKVDASKIIDSFVGDSEKNIRAVFERYHSLVKKAKIAPILFLNEADGLLTKRVSGDAVNPSVVQMWNTMQNIILEELENMEGIMIAATNLAVNMDKAFERRFLFKIRFEKPGLQNRQAIWRSMLPELTGIDTEELALHYEFSGAQIENITRKYTVESVLSGRKPTLDGLRTFCEEELPLREGRIGF